MSQATVIGEATVVRGNVRGEGSLEILGRVEGDVSVSGAVLIGESGKITGNIAAGKITILGTVQGDLRGTEAVLVERGGRVVGDLEAPRIGIGSGALVRGSVRTEGEPTLTVDRRSPRVIQTPDIGRVRGSIPIAPTVTSLTKAEVRIPAPPPGGELESPPNEPAARAKQAERRPPPPVFPSLGKGAKAKKKKSRERD